MTIDTLRDFVREIERAGELVRVAHPVDIKLEIAEITDRVMKSPGGGPALLFEKPVLANGKTSPVPVGINLFGSMRRMGISLGVERLDEIGGRISELLNLKVPDGLLGKLSMLPKLAEVAKFPPRTRSGKPACQSIVLQGDEVDLASLPILTTWPDDGGPYITFPMVMGWPTARAGSPQRWRAIASDTRATAGAPGVSSSGRSGRPMATGVRSASKNPAVAQPTRSWSGPLGPGTSTGRTRSAPTDSKLCCCAMMAWASTVEMAQRLEGFC